MEQQMNNKQWSMAVEKDTDSDELILTFPDDLIEQMDWQIGDTLIWTDNQDGSWTLSKQSV